MQDDALHEHVWSLGRAGARQEDARLTTGRGCYLDDISRPGLLHCAMLRSPPAHARIVSVDASAAERMRGVSA